MRGSTARPGSGETVELSRQRGIYCQPEGWEKIRRRARKERVSVSHLGVLCCLRAASGDAATAEPPGHPLALPEDRQRGLYETARGLARSRSFAVGGTTVALHEAVRFLLLTEGDGEE